LAHDYEKIDGTVVCEGILAKLDDVDEYLRQITTSLGVEL
jgi:uncharacterized protein YutE (UPF0331/DUF86 family)